MDSLPYTPLSDEDKRAYEATMLAGNSRLKHWHQKIKEQKSRKYSRVQFRKDFLQAVKNNAGVVCVEGICIPDKDVKKILAVKKIEWPLVTGFSRLVMKQAKRWIRRDHDAALDFEDLRNEGLVALTNAIYHYNSETVRFSTFAYHSIHRRLITVCTRASSFSPRSNGNIELYQLYVDVLRKANGPVTFDEIVERLQLSKKQIHTLRSMLVQSINASNLPSIGADDADYSGGDYSQLGSQQGEYVVSGHQQGAGVIFRREEQLELDQLDAVEDAGLTDFERKVLEAYLASGGRGWMTEFAEENLNAQGKAMSRAWVSQTMQRVREKILKRYSAAEADALLRKAS